MVPPGVKVKEEKQRLQIITHFTRTNNSGLELGQDAEPPRSPTAADRLLSAAQSSSTQWLPVAAVCSLRAGRDLSARSGTRGPVCVALLDDPSSSRHPSALQRQNNISLEPYYNSLIYYSHSDNKNNKWPSGRSLTCHDLRKTNNGLNFFSVAY